MDLDAEFDAVIAPAIDAAMAKDATFIPCSGLPIAQVKVYLNRDVDRIGADNQGVSRQHEVEYLKSAISGSPLDGKFIIDGRTYHVTEIVFDDGLDIGVTVK